MSTWSVDSYEEALSRALMIERNLLRVKLLRFEEMKGVSVGALDPIKLDMLYTNNCNHIYKELFNFTRSHSISFVTPHLNESSKTRFMNECRT